MDIKETLLTIGVVLFLIFLVVGLPLYAWLKPLIFGGNKKMVDTEYNFNKCITYLGGEKMEFEIENWLDYEGEQIQVQDKNGNVYLLSSFNTILVKESE